MGPTRWSLFIPTQSRVPVGWSGTKEHLAINHDAFVVQGEKREQEDDKKIPEDIMAQQFDAFEYPLIEEGFDILEKVH